MRFRPREQTGVCVCGYRCCKAHDKCWELSRKQPGCTGLGDLPYIIDYDLTCNNKQVTCSGELPLTAMEPFQLQAPPPCDSPLCVCVCVSVASNSACAAAACECDRESAHCFARNVYDPKYKDLDRAAHC